MDKAPFEDQVNPQPETHTVDKAPFEDQVNPQPETHTVDKAPTEDDSGEQDAVSSANIHPPPDTVFELTAPENVNLVLFTATFLRASGSVHCRPLKESEHCFVIKSIFLNRLSKCTSFTYDPDRHTVGTTIAWPVSNSRIKEIRISNKTDQPNKKINTKSDKDSSSSISKQHLKSKDSSCSKAGNLSYNDNDYIDIFWGAHQIGSGYYYQQSDASSGEDCYEIQVRIDSIYEENMKYVSKAKQKLIVVGKYVNWPILETRSKEQICF